MLQEDKRPLTFHSRMAEIRWVQKDLQSIVLRCHAFSDLHKRDILGSCELAWHYNSIKVFNWAAQTSESQTNYECATVLAVSSWFEPH